MLYSKPNFILILMCNYIIKQILQFSVSYNEKWTVSTAAAYTFLLLFTAKIPLFLNSQMVVLLVHILQTLTFLQYKCWNNQPCLCAAVPQWPAFLTSVVLEKHVNNMSEEILIHSGHNIIGFLIIRRTAN